jgi:hypothetical protein
VDVLPAALQNPTWSVAGGTGVCQYDPTAASIGAPPGQGFPIIFCEIPQFGPGEERVITIQGTLAPDSAGTEVINDGISGYVIPFTDLFAEPDFGNNLDGFESAGSSSAPPRFASPDAASPSCGAAPIAAWSPSSTCVACRAAPTRSRSRRACATGTATAGCGPTAPARTGSRRQTAWTIPARCKRECRRLHGLRVGTA